jgi:tRNA threonylcarbamoyladenosine biosynthesis protein TsaE
MGAGKTTLTKAICEVLGVLHTVNSPTFALVNEYETMQNEVIYHFDFYRIKNTLEALEIGVYEYLDSGNLCLIEWSSKISSLLPSHYLQIDIEKSLNPLEQEWRLIKLKRI